MPGGSKSFARKFSQIAQIFTKQSNRNEGHTYMNLSYELIKHVKSAISTTIYIYDTISVIVDYRVGIFPFGVKKCNVTDTLLPHGAEEVSFQSAQLT